MDFIIPNSGSTIFLISPVSIFNLFFFIFIFLRSIEFYNLVRYLNGVCGKFGNKGMAVF